VQGKIRKKAFKVIRRIGRSAAFVALASKLLVPVGYMPAALADGGPVRLCDMGLSFDTNPPARAHSLGHGAIASGASVEDRQDSASQSHQVREEDAHDHGATSEHGPWERCALGSLASLAALTGDSAPSILSSRLSEGDFLEPATLRGRADVATRARGPPPFV
jgi:hypothetical protein